MYTSPAPLATALRGAWILAVTLAAVLVCSGLLVFPAAYVEWRNTLSGIFGVLMVLIGYALFGLWGLTRLRQVGRPLLSLVLVFGLVATVVYPTEVLSEYVLLPRDNTSYGLIEFGLVFLSYLTAGVLAGRQTSQPFKGMVVAVGAALISTLLWYIVVLAVSYAMKGTPQQTIVFRAEGNLEDFARSGSANFEAWLMQDFLGAGFYHLLFSPLIAAILGSAGGLAGNFLPGRSSRHSQQKSSAIR